MCGPARPALPELQLAACTFGSAALPSALLPALFPVPQERPEDVPTGDLPRSMMCLLDRRLVGSVSPGARVTAVGILSIFQGKEGEPCQQRQAREATLRGCMASTAFRQHASCPDLFALRRQPA